MGRGWGGRIGGLVLGVWMGNVGNGVAGGDGGDVVGWRGGRSVVVVVVMMVVGVLELMMAMGIVVGAGIGIRVGMYRRGIVAGMGDGCRVNVGEASTLGLFLISRCAAPIV